MRLRIITGLAVGALAVALAGCSNTTAEPPAEPADPGTPTETELPYDAPAPAGAVLTTADSPFGEIVVDGAGLTVYLFDNDVQGGDASACQGECAANWFPVAAGSDDPKVEGVTGEIGTITGIDGEPQVTLDGWPLYTYAGDAAAGDTNGQGVNGLWWVVTPAGEKVGG